MNIEPFPSVAPRPDMPVTLSSALTAFMDHFAPLEKVKEPHPEVLRIFAMARKARAEEAAEAPMAYIWSDEHRMFWRPNAQGYCADIRQAGLYVAEEVSKYLAHAGPEKKLVALYVSPAPSTALVEAA